MRKRLSRFVRDKSCCIGEGTQVWLNSLAGCRLWSSSVVGRKQRCTVGTRSVGRRRAGGADTPAAGVRNASERMTEGFGKH